MQPLLDAVVDFATLVSPAKVRAVASALRGLEAPDTAPNLNSFIDTPAARDVLGRVFAAWEQAQTNGGLVAGMLLGASEARRRSELELSVELVWTGPTTPFVPTRRTEPVLLDLIASATEDIFLVSFVAYDIPKIVAALNEAASRGVRLRSLLEASTSHGGTLNYSPAALMRSRVPSAELFTWIEKPEPFVDGKVHAKVAVVDGSRAFLTSANLTAHALEKNMEAGVLINGGTVPGMLIAHFDSLASLKVIVPVGF